MSHLRIFSEICKVSSIYESSVCEKVEPQPKYLNIVVELNTTLSPITLLRCLLEIENIHFGRVRSLPVLPKFEPPFPRTVDLDIIFYGNSIIRCHAEPLTVPHPRMHKRAFVVVPLNQIAPDIVHPVLGKKVWQILQQLNLQDIKFFKHCSLL